MKIKGQLDWTDYLHSQFLHIRQDRLTRITTYALLAIALAGGLYLIAAGLVPFVSMMPAIIVIAFLVLYRYVFLPQRVKRLFYQQKELQVPFEFEFTDTGLGASNEFGSSMRPWNTFRKWKEDKDLLLLYHSDILYSIIPKRFFPDAQQIETVKAFLVKNDVPAAKSRSRIGCVIYILLLILAAWILYINFRNAGG